MKCKNSRWVCSFGLAVLLLAACDNAQFGAREKGALGGAALGAGLGAIVGNQTGSTGAGIAIGSAVGALSGALVGNSIDNQNASIKERDDRLAAQERELAENRRLIEELKAKGVDARSSERGVVANLPDVLFEFNSYALTREARNIVSDIAKVVRDTRGRRISVEGHTDSIGTTAYNQKLSEQRARSVADDLVASGVSRGVVRVRGFGESNPIASNNTEAGRKRNRRVEVVIENR